MKVQIRRNVFETNSSSVHSLSIIQMSTNTNYPDELVFDEGCFGWENTFYNDTRSKASYIWECIKDGFPYYDKQMTREYCVEKITKILADHNIKAVFLYNNIKKHTSEYHGEEYSYDIYVNAEGKEDSGYVDHSDEAYMFIDSMLKDGDKLMNFLFDSKSWIITGNDNQEDEDFLDEPDNGPAWKYEKGN